MNTIVEIRSKSRKNNKRARILGTGKALRKVFGKKYVTVRSGTIFDGEYMGNWLYINLTFRKNNKWHTQTHEEIRAEVVKILLDANVSIHETKNPHSSKDHYAIIIQFMQSKIVNGRERDVCVIT